MRDSFGSSFMSDNGSYRGRRGAALCAAQGDQVQNALGAAHVQCEHRDAVGRVQF